MADDTRIVQMQFDNKDFEKNIAKSQSSLDKFKKSLNFDAVGKGLSNFENSVKNLAFDSLNNNIQKLTDKFTGLGRASEYVLSRIRASLEGVALQAEQFVKSLTMEQVRVGQNKYDALTKSVQTIVASESASEEQAYNTMERVMEYTNQTSHSFETMVAQISSLTSIGVPLEKAEKLMEGFANASTKAGADASHSAIAMQTYAKAMGSYLTKNEFDTLNLTAKVVTKEWREQLIEAGIAAGDLEKDAKGVIKTAKKYGKQVEVTADTIENTLNKKWASKKTLSMLGEKYMFGDSIEDLRHPERVADSFGKTAYLTGQRALTFADALNAVKESISGGWMSSFRIIFGDLTDAMNLWTGSCNKVIDALSGLSDARNKVLSIWKDLGGRDNIIKLIFGEMEDTEGNIMYEGAYGIVDAFTEMGDIISGAFWETFKNLIPKDQQDRILSEVNNNLRALGLEKSFESFDELWNSDFFVDSGGRTSFLAGALQGVTEDIQNMISGIHEWFNEVDDNGVSRFQKIQNILTAIGRTIAFVVEVGGGLIHFFEVLGDENHLGPSLSAISELLNTLGLNVLDAENNVSNSGGIIAFFDNLAETLKPACELINIVVGSFTELISAMILGEKENSNFGKVLEKIGNVLKKVFGYLIRIATPISTFISEISGIFGDLFKDGFTEEGVEQAKQRFSEALVKLWDGLKEAFVPLLKKIGEVFSIIWEEIKNRAVEYFNDPQSLGYKILEPIKKVLAFLNPVWEMLKTVWNAIRGLFVGKDGQLQGPTLFDTLKVLFMSEGVTNLFHRMKQLAKDGGLYKLITGVLGGVAIWRIIKAVNTIGAFFDDVGGNLKAGILGSYEWFSEKLQGIAKGILMLAGSVALLGSMDTGSVIQGVVSLGAIMAEFFLFMHLMNSVDGATLTKQAGLTGAISILAGAIGLLVLSLLPFAFVSWGGFARMFVGLTLVMAEVIGFVELLKVLNLSAAGLNMTGMYKFALSVGILIFSLVPFMLADWERMLRGVAGLAIVLGEIIGFMKLLNILGLKAKGLNTTGMYKFAFSMGILMLSLVPFMLADWESMLRGVAGLAIVMAEILGFMKLLSILSLSADGLNMTGMYKFAFSVGIIMLSLTPFLLTDWSGMFRAVVGLALIFAEVIVAMTLIQRINLMAAGPMTGFIAFAASVGILMLALIPLMVTNWDGMLRSVIGLGIVLAELVGFMKLVAIAGLAESTALTGFIGFALSMAVLMFALKPLGEMSWEGLARAVLGLTAVLTEMIIFMAVAGALSVNPATIPMIITMCLGLSVIALTLSMAMNEVRNLKWDVITAFMAGLSVTMIAMAGAIVILSSIPFGAGIKGIGLLAAGIGIIVGEIALLAPLLMSSIGNGLTGLGGKLELVASMLTNFSNKMGTVDEGNINKATGIFSSLRTLMNQLNGWGKFIGNTNDFAYSMFVLGTSMEIFNNHVGNQVSDLDSNAQAALKFIQDLSGCANDLDTISKMNMNALIVAIAELGGAMTIYSYGAKEVQGLLGEGDAPDETTVGAAIQIMKDISTGLAEAGGFTIPDNMPDDQKLSLFGASLAALASALVQFEAAGKDLGGGTEKALQCLDFFKSLKDKLIKQDFAQGIGEAIGIFEKNQITKDKLTQFGTNIEQLGSAMKQFNLSTTTIDTQTGEMKPIDFSNAIGTLDSLVELQGKLEWDFGPVIQFFAGRRQNFLDLAAEIEGLGTALKDFTDKLGGVDEAGQPKLDTTLFESAITISDQIVEYMKTMATKMGLVGGLRGIVGMMFKGRDFNFTDLKQQMTDLAEGLGSLGQLKVDDKLITVSETEGIFKVLDGVVQYLDKLKTEQGRVGGAYNDVVNFFAKGYDFDFVALKGQLIALGEGLNGLGSFDAKNLPTAEELEGAVFPMVTALTDYLNKLKKEMDPVGGLANDLNGLFGTGYDFDFKALKGQLTALGDGLNSISSVVVDSEGNTLFNKEGRGTAIETVDALLDYMQTLSSDLGRIGGISQFFNNLWNGKEADFEYVGSQLGALGRGLGEFGSGITANGAFNASGAAEALGALDHLVSMMQTFSVLEEKMDAISMSYNLHNYTVKNFMQNLNEALYWMSHSLGGEVSGTVVEQLAEFVKEFDIALNDTENGLGGLADSNAPDILNTVAQSISNLVTAARNMQNEDGSMIDFQIVGQNISNGIAAGIANATGVVTAAARAVVQAAVAAANAEADSHSPSRVFMTVGGFMGQGLAIGFSNQKGIVENAATEVTDSAIDSATNAMALFTQLMSQDIDANPTITPVVDLSNVTAGSAAINGLLAGDKELSLAGAGGDYSGKTIPGNNGTTGDYRGQDLTFINTAIQGLGARIDAMGARISQMQIVMNTGALVGQVTDGINKNLGQKTIYGRRRN